MKKDAAAFPVSVATAGSRCTMVVTGGDTVGEATLVATREGWKNPEMRMTRQRNESEKNNFRDKLQEDSNKRPMKKVIP